LVKTAVYLLIFSCRVSSIILKPVVDSFVQFFKIGLDLSLDWRQQ